MKTKIKKLGVLSLTIIFGLSACVSDAPKEGGNEQNATEDTLVEKVENKEVKEIQTFFYNLPSPIEISYLFKLADLSYHSSLMHNTADAANYGVSAKKALNLGVYGADLSYSALFNNHQEALKYLNTCQQLASDLGIDQGLQKELLGRIERNKDNKDTLLQVISDFFIENDAYLKENQQNKLSTYVVLGGWTEAIYLGTQLDSKGKDNKKIRAVIESQEASLDNLLKMLKGIENDDILAPIIAQLEELSGVYGASTNATTDNKEMSEMKDGKLVLKTVKSTSEVSAEKFEKIKSLISEIRTNIIQ